MLPHRHRLWADNKAPSCSEKRQLFGPKAPTLTIPPTHAPVVKNDNYLGLRRPLSPFLPPMDQWTAGQELTNDHHLIGKHLYNYLKFWCYFGTTSSKQTWKDLPGRCYDVYSAQILSLSSEVPHVDSPWLFHTLCIINFSYKITNTHFQQTNLGTSRL